MSYVYETGDPGEIDSSDNLTRDPINQRSLNEAVSNELPDFEGEQPKYLTFKIVKGNKLDVDPELVRVGDRIRVEAVYSCVGVGHTRDTNDQLVRVQMLEAVYQSIMPFVDGEDDGILRRRYGQ